MQLESLISQRQTDLSTLSAEHPYVGLSFLSLQSLHLKQTADRAKKISSDPFTRFTPFSTNMLQIAAHSYNCFKYSDHNTEIKSIYLQFTLCSSTVSVVRN